MDKLVFTPNTRNRRYKYYSDENVQKIDSLLDFAVSVGSLDNVAVPLRLMYKGIEIRILEVAKTEFHDHTDYFVVVQLKHGDRITLPFTIYCNSIDDFIRKLRIELIRFRMFKRLLPDTIVTITQETSF